MFFSYFTFIFIQSYLPFSLNFIFIHLFYPLFLFIFLRFMFSFKLFLFIIFILFWQENVSTFSPAFRTTDKRADWLRRTVLPVNHNFALVICFQSSFSLQREWN